jgi:hypothetical protein
MMTKKIVKFYRWKIKFFLTKQCNLFIPKPAWRTSAFKRVPSTLKHKIFSLLLTFFLDICTLVDPDPVPVDQNQCWSMRIWVQNTVCKRSYLTLFLFVLSLNPFFRHNSPNSDILFKINACLFLDHWSAVLWIRIHIRTWIGSEFNEVPTP